MKSSSPRRFLLALGLLMLTAPVAHASDSYPDRPITIIVPYAPGGGGDTFTRAIAQQAQRSMGSKIFVENRPGGGATIGVGAVARAKADGYTLGFVSSSPVVAVPNFVRVPYKPDEDLVYIARFVLTPTVVMVRFDAPWRSFSELLDYGRANPGRLTWSAAATNGAPHIATEVAFRKEGVESAYIPMQGSPEVLAALLGDTIDVGVVSDFEGPVNSGDVRVLAELGRNSFPVLKGVPTFGNLGYPLAPSVFFGLIGPAGLPGEIVGRWSKLVAEIVATAQFAELAVRLNGTVAYQDHKAFQAGVESEIVETRRALSELGLVR